jgi:hypothetical protein
MSLYNEQLAKAVLRRLNEVFPTSQDDRHLMKALPNFSLPHEEWMTALNALTKEGLITGHLIPVQGGVIREFATFDGRDSGRACDTSRNSLRSQRGADRLPVGRVQRFP